MDGNRRHRKLFKRVKPIFAIEYYTFSMIWGTCENKIHLWRLSWIYVIITGSLLNYKSVSIFRVISSHKQDELLIPWLRRFACILANGNNSNLTVQYWNCSTVIGFNVLGNKYGALWLVRTCWIRDKI